MNGDRNSDEERELVENDRDAVDDIRSSEQFRDYRHRIWLSLRPEVAGAAAETIGVGSHV